MPQQEKKKRKFAQKMAFSKFVDSKEIHASEEWKCCEASFTSLKDFHKHVAASHQIEIEELAQNIFSEGSADARWSVLKRARKNEESNSATANLDCDLPETFDTNDEYPWLPLGDKLSQNTSGTVILFYKYRHISNTKHAYEWQKVLCERLELTGKVRVASEGLNVTVAGEDSSIERYIKSVICHPLFDDMKESDFKTSPGDKDSFPGGLKVGIYAEAVPMGQDPDKVSFQDAGHHLTVDEFHEAVKNHMTKPDQSADTESVLVDCRNFYESKIGKFDGALTPDIRKFSYWPEYVDQNLDVFKDKNVYMYCTGGIRCERGSAYLKSKGVCKDVYQLNGGIHKYIEKYPEGHFRGKLFVFDNRYALKANEDIISKCCYCKAPWDSYKPCTSRHCHQLVLSCDTCRQRELTACCKTCQKHQEENMRQEQCECTTQRARIPQEIKSDT